MIQKIIKVGNSFAITIPQNLVKEKKLSVGDSVNFSIEPVFTADKEVHELTRQLIKKYRPALEELASK